MHTDLLRIMIKQRVIFALPAREGWVAAVWEKTESNLKYDDLHQEVGMQNKRNTHVYLSQA